MIKVTLDTNIFPANDIIEICRDKSVELRIVTVTKRELSGSDIVVKLEPILETGVYGDSVYGQARYAAEKPVSETFVLGETPLGAGILGDSGSADNFEFILKIISSGSFPKKGLRTNLTKGDRNQLRDALIFEAHVRDRRDIFVTKDKSGFIGHAKDIRTIFENKFTTKILTRTEFITYLAAAPHITTSAKEQFGEKMNCTNDDSLGEK